MKHLKQFLYYSTLSFSLFLTTLVLAASNETRSFRTPSGQMINIGDNRSQLDTSTLTPHSSSSYEFRQGKERLIAYTYHYEIHQVIYTVTVIKDKIVKIEWTRKH